MCLLTNLSLGLLKKIITYSYFFKFSFQTLQFQLSDKLLFLT
jgi:hypothetical protein